MHAGLERVGVTVIPASTGNTQRQLQIMRDFKTTVLVGTPSYVMHLTDVAPELGYDLDGPQAAGGAARLRAVDQPDAGRDREAHRACRPATSTGCRRSSARASRTSAGTRTACTSTRTTSWWRWSTRRTGEPVPEGKEGELVFTSLTKEALPVIRYRTGDLASVSYRPCACGRVFARHSKVYARTDDMLIIRGVNVYPSSIEAVLHEIEKVEPHYQIVVSREGALDQIEIQIEVEPSFIPDTVRKLQGFQQHVEERLRQELGIRPRVRLVEPRTIPATSRERSIGGIIDKPGRLIHCRGRLLALPGRYSVRR